MGDNRADKERSEAIAREQRVRVHVGGAGRPRIEPETGVAQHETLRRTGAAGLKARFQVVCSALLRDFQSKLFPVGFWFQYPPPGPMLKFRVPPSVPVIDMRGS